MKRPKISVYITAHNYGNYIVQAIESVLRQSYSDWECIVIDDCSTDHTRDVIQQFSNHHPVFSLIRLS